MLGALFLPGPLSGSPAGAETKNRPFFPPIESLILGESGTVIVEATADKEGKATDVRVGQSSNYERLDEAAVDYVSQMSIASGELPGNMRGAASPSGYPSPFRDPGTSFRRNEPTNSCGCLAAKR